MTPQLKQEHLWCVLTEFVVKFSILQQLQIRLPMFQFIVIQNLSMSTSTQTVKKEAPVQRNQITGAKYIENGNLVFN